MTKFSNKLKKPCFWPILGLFFPILGQKKFFSENSTLSRTTSYEFLEPCQISEKTYEIIPRKCLDRRPDRRMNDGHTLFYKSLPATTGGPKTHCHEGIQMDTHKKNKIK